MRRCLSIPICINLNNKGMDMGKSSFKKIICSLVFGVVMLSGCSSPDDDRIIIKLTNNSVDSQMIHNEIARLIVENGFEGYKVEYSTASSTMNLQAMIRGDVDVDIECWSDNIPSYKKDIASGDIVELGDLIPDSAQGFYVPRYVIEGDEKRNIKALAPDLKHVRDLINYVDVFESPEEEGRGSIYGGIPGWMIDNVMHKKYKHYNLDEKYEYVRLGSEAAIYAALSSAYNKGEGWVGYSFEPSVMSGKFDLVRLEDEPYEKALLMIGECEIPMQKLKTVTSRKFIERAPDLVPFFEKFQTGHDAIGAALVYLDESKKSYEEVAKWLLKENPEYLDQWLTAEQAKKVREAIK